MTRLKSRATIILRANKEEATDTFEYFKEFLESPKYNQITTLSGSDYFLKIEAIIKKDVSINDIKEVADKFDYLCLKDGNNLYIFDNLFI